MGKAYNTGEGYSLGKLLELRIERLIIGMDTIL